MILTRQSLLHETFVVRDAIGLSLVLIDQAVCRGSKVFWVTTCANQIGILEIVLVNVFHFEFQDKKLK